MTPPAQVEHAQHHIETPSARHGGSAETRRPLLDTRAAGVYTGLGERYLRRLRSDRVVPCVRIGGRLMFDPDDLDALIDRHRQSAISSRPRT